MRESAVAGACAQSSCQGLGPSTVEPPIITRLVPDSNIALESSTLSAPQVIEAYTLLSWTLGLAKEFANWLQRHISSYLFWEVLELEGPSGPGMLLGWASS